MSNSAKRVVYYFCYDLQKDPVAKNVFDECLKLYNLNEIDLEIDGYKVMSYEDKEKNLFYFVRLNEVLSHNYDEYLPVICKYFSDFDFAGIINWHDGANAPNDIICIHTTGDVSSGYFGNINPKYYRNLIFSLSNNLAISKLNNFRVMTEATHWSGIIYNTEPQKIIKYNVPLVDIEIGSRLESWNNKSAIEIIANSLIDIFCNNTNSSHCFTVLFFGGIHFEPSISDAVLNSGGRIMCAHILPSHWLVSGEYDKEENVCKLDSCIKSIIGDLDVIIYNDNIKGCYKRQIIKFANDNKIPCYKHKVLKNIEDFYNLMART